GGAQAGGGWEPAGQARERDPPGPGGPPRHSTCGGANRIKLGNRHCPLGCGQWSSPFSDGPLGNRVRAVLFSPRRSSTLVRGGQNFEDLESGKQQSDNS